MTFLQKVKESIYSPKFYKDIPSQTFSSALGYFLLLSLVLTGIESLFLIKPLIFEFKKEVQIIVESAINYYPQDLTITIRNGRVYSSEDPLVIPFPVQNTDESSQDFKNLVVIDTKTPYSSSQFDDFKTVAWVTADSLFIKNDDEIRTVDLARAPDFTLDRSVIRQITAKIIPYLSIIGPFLFIAFSILIFISYSIRLVYLLFLSLLIFIIAKIAKLSLPYRSIYKMGTYAMTLPLLVNLFIDKTSPFTGFTGISFMFSILTLGVIVLNFKSEPIKIVTKKKKIRHAHK